MNAALLLTVLALVSPIFGEETLVEKKQDKRGIYGLGYGGYYGGGLGYGGYGHSGYGGYLAAPTLGHGLAVAPAVSHSYSAPISLSHGYSAPLYSSYRLGHSGLGIGHGISSGYGVHGW